MVLTLQYRDQEETPRNLWVRPHEVVTIGSSLYADHQVEGDRELDKVHFQLRSEEHHWLVECLSDRPLRVNGDYTRLARLRHGDRILAGKTTFSIALPPPPDVPRSSPNAEAPKLELSTSDPLVTWWDGLTHAVTFLQAGLVEHRIERATAQLSQWLPYLNAFGATALAWNRKSYGDANATIAGWKVGVEDLFAQAPREITDDHSLAVGSLDWDKIDAETLASVLLSDTAVLLFHPLGVAELIEKKKIMWAWFARPSLLQHHLRHGSSMLTGNIIEGLDAIVTASNKAREVCIYGMQDYLGAQPMLADPRHPLSNRS